MASLGFIGALLCLCGLPCNANDLYDWWLAHNPVGTDIPYTFPPFSVQLSAGTPAPEPDYNCIHYLGYEQAHDVHFCNIVKASIRYDMYMLVQRILRERKLAAARATTIATTTTTTTTTLVLS